MFLARPLCSKRGACSPCGPATAPEWGDIKVWLELNITEHKDSLSRDVDPPEAVRAPATKS